MKQHMFKEVLIMSITHKAKPKTAGNKALVRNTSVRNIRKPITNKPTSISIKIDEIKNGYSIEKFEHLKEKLGVSKEILANVVNISLATMHRRKTTSGKLSSDESDKIYRLEKLYTTALEVLENKHTVQVWFNTEQTALGGKTPLEYADTLPGAEEVERVLRCMEHGIVI